MPALEISTSTDADVDAIVALWTRCDLTRPWNDARADIALARSSANATILVGRTQGKIAAAVMVGHDGHRGWVYYVAVDPDLRGTRLRPRHDASRRAMAPRTGIVKVMLMVRPDNTKVRAFYDGARLFRPAARGARQMARWARAGRRS